MEKKGIFWLMLVLLTFAIAVWYAVAVWLVDKPAPVSVVETEPEKNSQMLSLVTDEYHPYVIARVVDGKELDSDPAGFCAEVITEVFTRMGVSIESNTIYPWPRGLHLVKHGLDDAIYGAVYSPERAKFLHYPKEHMCSYSPRIVVPANKANQIKYKTFEDLKHLNFGGVRDSYFPPEFWKMVRKHDNIDLLTNMDHLYRFMRQGRIDAMIISVDELRWLERKYGEEGRFKPLPGGFCDEKLYLAFSKKSVSPELVERFSRALTQFKKTERFKILCRKYGLFGDIPKHPSQEMPAPTKRTK